MDAEAEWRAAAAAWEKLERNLDGRDPLEEDCDSSSQEEGNQQSADSIAASNAADGVDASSDVPHVATDAVLGDISSTSPGQRVHKRHREQQEGSGESEPPPASKKRGRPCRSDSALVSGFAMHTGGDAWSAAVGKPQLIPPVVAAASTAAASAASRFPLACPGCSNCCFARSAGGVCMGGGRPTHARERTAAELSMSRHASPSNHTTGSLTADVAVLPQHLRERTRVFKPLSSDNSRGSESFSMPVICWTRKALRAHENPALDVGICAANRLGRPLIVLIEVEDRYPYSTARRQHFVLEGVAELQRELKQRGIRFATHVHRDGHRQRPACSMAYRASLIIAEEPFCAPWQHGVQILASGKFVAPVWLVDCETIVPAAQTNPNSCHRAWQYENAVKSATNVALLAMTPWPEQTLLQQCQNSGGSEVDRMTAGLIGSNGSRSFWPVAIRCPKNILSPSHRDDPNAGVHGGIAPRENDPEIKSIEDLVKAMDCDHSVTRVRGTPGGSSAGYERWRKFVESGGLRSYAARRNNALDPAGVSRMSCYLNLGMVSPFRIARDVRATGKVRGNKSGCNKFEKEFLTWRGIAFAWCYHVSPTTLGQADAPPSIQLLPQWARSTLLKHASDPRERILGLPELRAARSGDAVWDALQMSLVSTGELHNNARMGWGKALLNWTANPESCLLALLDLNNRYALDGHSPPSMAGLLGCMGLFETPRGERAVTGSVGMRGLKRKYAALKPRSATPEVVARGSDCRHLDTTNHRTHIKGAGSSDVVSSAWQELTLSQQAEMAAAFGFELSAVPP